MHSLFKRIGHRPTLIVTFWLCLLTSFAYSNVLVEPDMPPTQNEKVKLSNANLAQRYLSLAQHDDGCC